MAFGLGACGCGCVEEVNVYSNLQARRDVRRMPLNLRGRKEDVPMDMIDVRKDAAKSSPLQPLLIQRAFLAALSSNVVVIKQTGMRPIRYRTRQRILACLVAKRANCPMPRQFCAAPIICRRRTDSIDWRVACAIRLRI